MSSSKEQVIRRYFGELFDQGRTELAFELLAPDYVNHSPGSPDLPRGRDGVVTVVQARDARVQRATPGGSSAHKPNG